jgi:hypothetical protein
MTWPTKSKRPIRRSTFGHAANFDPWLWSYRYATTARLLGEIDWLLHRHSCCPWPHNTHAAHAYNRGFNAERAANPHPDLPPLPDIPRARQRLGMVREEKKSLSD